MSKILSVAWRDFTHTVLTKAFLFAVVGVPLMIVIAGGATVLIMMQHEEPPIEGTIAVVDSVGDLADAVALEFNEEQMREDQQEQIDAMTSSAMENAANPLGGADMMNSSAALQRGEVRIDVERIDGEAGMITDDLKERVAEGDYLAVIAAGDELLEIPEDRQSADALTFQVVAAEDMDVDHVTLIQRRVSQAIVRARVDRAGGDIEHARALVTRPSAETVRLGEAGEETSEGELQRELRRIIPIFFMMLLWIASFTGGQHLLMSTIEEKSNKVMEVLLSAVSPMQLMVGKIIGQGMVGLLLVTVYSSLSILGVIAASQAGLIEPMQLVYLFVYFLMAYFMVATMMAAVGSAVSDIREANNLVTPVMLIVMVPLFLWMPISQAPNGTIAQVFSYIPPAIPFVMILRVTADEPVAAWQIIATILWGGVCVVGMMWMAAKIFRIGVLMQGKPPSLVQLVKWLRYDH
ncbi:MAG: ABC transporter permease [Planctomycetota bacterium]